ncbi:Wzy polymerase domain-containing protein [Variovorax sp. EBFNA2]|uniref:PglL family O-oligosaccharyltransferase n=1 Tax=Variovorax sp. EBFNA2 TaxID=3342097 RepID=UPI0029C074FE|nr:Wzy polymerase domain-containing protein [Variovorax boronicumulans]WPG37634.1 Wzy polymerase domain-containing protein [Variovorax boronicumulans]
MTVDAARASPTPVAERASFIVLAGLVALPFLSPLVAGPSVNTWQTFVTGACLAGLLVLIPTAPLQRKMWVWLAASAFFVALSDAGRVTAFLWPTLGVFVGIGAAASVGAGAVSGQGPYARSVAVGLLAAGLLSAVLGLLQYYGLAESLGHLTTSPSVGRAWGNLRQRNQFATLINLTLVAALWLYASRRSRRAGWSLGGAAVLLIAALAASVSRTGLLQLLMIVGIAGVMAWRERHPSQGGAEREGFNLPALWFLLSALPLYAAFHWLLPYLASVGSVASSTGMLHRLQPTVVTTDSRVVLWQNVLTLIAQRPLTGWGWGELSFAHFATLYNGPRFPVILDNAHNLPLHLAVELGIPAALLICGGFLWLVAAAKPWREHDPLRLMAWGLLGVILLHSLLEYPLWYGPFQLVFGLCLGILWPASPQRPAVNGSRKLATFAATAWIAVIGYAAWDYTRISQIYLPRDARLPAYRDDTLAKLQGSWLFSRQVDFAELTLTAVTPANAAHMHELAGRVLHFSPEPRVIMKLIESAELLGRDAEAQALAARFRVAFPAAFARWMDNRPDDAPEL